MKKSAPANGGGSQVGLIPGVSDEMFAPIRPALTVHSQQPNVDRRTAPREALLALPNMDARQVDSILAERTRSNQS